MPDTRVCTQSRTQLGVLMTLEYALAHILRYYIYIDLLYTLVFIYI